MFAIRFDLTRLEASGNPVPILEDVTAVPLNGSADFSVSDDGTLIYREGTQRGAESPLRWLDASGSLTTLRAQATDWRRPRFSRDGRLALSIGGADIWIYEPARDLTKVTFHRGRQAGDIVLEASAPPGSAPVRTAGDWTRPK